MKIRTLFVSLHLKRIVAWSRSRFGFGVIVAYPCVLHIFVNICVYNAIVVTFPNRLFTKESPLLRYHTLVLLYFHIKQLLKYIKWKQSRSPLGT